jgi:hypothetical protein
MQSKRISSLCVSVLIAFSLSCAHGQVVAAGHENRVHFPVEVGVSVSDFNMDWGKDQYGGQHREDGVTAWINTDIPLLSHALKGLALEIEGRDINFSHPVYLSKLRTDTILGGATYTWRSTLPVRPYAKFLAGMGSIDFPSRNPKYTHDTRAVTAPGVGVEARIHGPFWVRADYEYQFWRKLFGPNSLNPNGFSFGVEFDSRTLSQNQY